MENTTNQQPLGLPSLSDETKRTIAGQLAAMDLMELNPTIQQATAFVGSEAFLKRAQLYYDMFNA